MVNCPVAVNAGTLPPGLPATETGLPIWVDPTLNVTVPVGAGPYETVADPVTVSVNVPPATGFVDVTCWLMDTGAGVTVKEVLLELEL